MAPPSSFWQDPSPPAGSVCGCVSFTSGVWISQFIPRLTKRAVNSGAGAFALGPSYSHKLPVLISAASVKTFRRSGVTQFIFCNAARGAGGGHTHVHFVSPQHSTHADSTPTTPTNCRPGRGNTADILTPVQSYCQAAACRCSTPPPQQVPASPVMHAGVLCHNACRRPMSQCMQALHCHNAWCSVTVTAHTKAPRTHQPTHV